MREYINIGNFDITKDTLKQDFLMNLIIWSLIGLLVLFLHYLRYFNRILEHKFLDL